MNIVEFGPDTFGIAAAARDYFHIEPSDLSIGQALYLASILPRPSSQHFDAEGAVSERWSEYLRHLMRIAHKIRRLSDEELETGLQEKVRRGPPAHADDSLFFPLAP
jgi:membrane peptidoglycan carboxypeptidase